jgi:hypothetical protein
MIAMKIVCSVCNSDAYKITPPWANNEKVYGCGTCGGVLKADGTKFMNAGEVAEVFRANEMVEKIFPDLSEMPPILGAVLYARIIEFGTKMWLDGLKQGLLYGSKQTKSE